MCWAGGGGESDAAMRSHLGATSYYDGVIAWVRVGQQGDGPLVGVMVGLGDRIWV